MANHFHELLQEDPTIGEAVDNWDQTVETFEANKNSVVIAAGNEGLGVEKLTSKNHDLPINVPEGFSTNILENELVTSVGATETRPVGGRMRVTRADYSSNSNGVDIYADGRAPGSNKSTGTSFSAPRVAAVMSDLHRQNPDLSSQDVENLMKQALTYPIETVGGEIDILDPEMAGRMMNNHN